MSSLREMESDAGTQTSSNSVSPTPPVLTHADPDIHFGTVIPNRIFVGGIDAKTNENDLRRFFSHYGTVKEVKIVVDRAGVSKGYGFVTFGTPEDAQKILNEASTNRLCYRDKRLNIGQAVRKQQVATRSGGYTVAGSSPPLVLPAPFGAMHMTTPTGYPYTYYNGVAYFHNPEPNTHPSLWPASHTVPGSAVMVAHPAPPFFTPQAYHQHQGPSQCVNGPVPWAFPHVESPVPSTSSPLLYVQPAEMMYHSADPMENGCAQSGVPPMEAGVPEGYMDHMAQPPYQICLSPLILAQGDGVKEPKFHSVIRSFSHSAFHLRPRYNRGPHYKHLRRDYRPDLQTSLPPPPPPPPISSSPMQDALK